MRKVLPMGNPIMDSYPSYGGGFSILDACTKEHLPWVYNTFVQVAGSNKRGQENLISYVGPDIFLCPMLDATYLNRNLALSMMDPISLVKSFINQGYYFYAYFRVEYVAVYKESGFRHHEMLIYGYDDEREEFYFADNYKQGKYAHGVASYAEVEKAIYVDAEFDDRVGLRGFKHKDHDEIVSFKFDKETYITLLEDYVYQRDSRRFWQMPGLVISIYENRTYGIGVYSYIREYMDFIKRTNQYMDHRGFCVLKEQKKLLKKSLEYVLGESLEVKNPALGMKLNSIRKLIQINLNLCLKYNITFDIRITDKIKDNLSVLEVLDRELYEGIIGMLYSQELHDSEIS